MSKYQRWLEPQGLTLLEGWARDGLSDAQIAHNCGVSSATLCNWKKQLPDLAAALEKGREVVDYEVENALLRRALGFSYAEVTLEESGDSSKRREVTKLMAPDVSAQIFWLKNRRRDKWRDKPPEDAAAAGDCGVVVLPEVGEDEKDRSATPRPSDRYSSPDCP